MHAGLAGVGEARELTVDLRDRYYHRYTRVWKLTAQDLDFEIGPICVNVKRHRPWGTSRNPERQWTGGVSIAVGGQCRMDMLRAVFDALCAFQKGKDRVQALEVYRRGAIKALEMLAEKEGV